MLRIMTIFFAVILCVLLVAFVVLSLPRFGAQPKGKRLEQILQSPNYRDGKFRNLHPTPQLTNEGGVLAMIKKSLAAKNKRPSVSVPSVKTDLHRLPVSENVLVWLGHSSYFLQVDRVRILVDPVLSGYASPFPFSMKAFPGSNEYSVDDLPNVDVLIITHDHWDHLDYKVVKALEPKVGKVLTGLGVGAHFERWGYPNDKVIEMDWYETKRLSESVQFHCLPARHFSGRGLRPQKTLWVAFALLTEKHRIFLGGDGGYDTHFSAIGKELGPFDLAVLENGQYDSSWKYIHMMPEETAQAAMDLRAKRLLPVHYGKFALANHAWDEPLKRISKAASERNLPLVTPKIGEPVFLDKTDQTFQRWWEQIATE